MPLPVNTKHLKKSGKDTCENFVINFNEEFKPGFEDPKIASHNIADSVTGNDEVKGEEMCVKSFQNYSEDHKTRCGKKFVGNLEISEDSADDNQNFLSPSEKTEQKEPFKYELSEGMLVFHRMSFDYKMRCPRCQVETKYIIRHVNQNTKCQAGINGDVFKIQFLKYKKETKDMNIVRQEQRERKVKSRARMKAVNNERLKRQQREYEKKSIAAMRALDNENVKQKQKCRKVKSRKELRAVDYEKFKRQERIYKGKSLFKKRAQDNNKVKLDQKILQENHRNINTAQDRLKNFKEATKFNAIFICTCCHQRMFESNVQVFSETFKNDITKRFPDIIRQSVTEPYIISIKDGKKECFICKTCIKYLKLNKMPPMSVLNGLVLKETDEDIKNQDLQLTELEAALISKNIIFQKIFQLPKSRWTALKDRVINVPIKEDSILNTLERLPRTPQDAGLIGVALKRKKEYDKTHKHQLVNTEKMYKMLEKLKKNKNPFYQFYDDYNTYEQRCKKADFKGYTFIFDEETEPIEDLSDKKAKDEEEIVWEELLEKEYKTKDPVKKFQFDDYNKSLCMSNLYPEMDPANSIIVAPGEGKSPQNILFDDDWDILAFPHLNSPDGKYGLYHQRQTKLQDQYYFIQRICNMNPKFARSPAYIYAAVAHTELKQIQRNINVSYSRGKETNNSDGVKSLKLEDPFAVLDDIKQTPRYWKKAKFEIFAKLDNFGPFQFFFTLSCADLRWPENFAAILRSKGFILKYVTEEDQDGYPKTVVYVEHNKDGVIMSDPLDKFLKEQQDESLHEFIRGNVLLATRYFNHRVKSFITNIMMGGGNPMMVEYYSYKTEFQDRGAGHIHGVLWIKLHQIEKLCKFKDGSLHLMNEKDKAETQEEFKQPFKGINLHSRNSELESPLPLMKKMQ